jgi:hypothetical protein
VSGWNKTESQTIYERIYVREGVVISIHARSSKPGPLCLWHLLLFFNRSAATEESLDYVQQIHCVVIWVHMPLFDKWRRTDAILLFVWLAVEMWQKCASHTTNHVAMCVLFFIVAPSTNHVLHFVGARWADL